MVDWSSSMKQTYEFFKVDPGSWADVERLSMVTDCTVNRDESSDTLGSASFEIDEYVGECYIRVYLVAEQNSNKDKEELGVFLVQSPSTSFNGKRSSFSLDGYTPLIELKETMPSLGFTVMKNSNILEHAYELASEHMRAPVVKTEGSDIQYANFTADTDDTWFSFISDLIAQIDYSFGLDENSRIIFLPKQELSAMQPVWTYTDDNSSILLPDVDIESDIYDIPNVVEVVYSGDTKYFEATARNDDENSITSTVNRGREILYRETSPSFNGTPDEDTVQKYANDLLESLSEVETTIEYSHGYCPVKLGDCVTLNYKSAGIVNVKAKVTKQTINCKTGCTVSETAVYTKRLWEA